MLEKKVNALIHNRFDIEVINGKTGEIKQKARAFNVVCNNLWTYLINSGTAFATYIQYGSGSGTPSASDTSLFNRVNGVAVTEVSKNTDLANNVVSRVCRITLGLSTSVGVTITEVGLAAGAGNGTLTTHAMLQDMNGNSISIAKTDTDIINIYATIFCHCSAANGSVNIDYKATLINNLTGQVNNFGSFTVGVSDGNTRVYNTKTCSKSADVANKKIVYTIPRFTESEGNISGINDILGTGNFEGIDIKRGTWPSFSIENESVGTGDGSTTQFSTKFGFPTNAVVKVNGVAQSASSVTVKNIGKSWWANFRLISPESTDNHVIELVNNSWALAGKSLDSMFINKGYSDGVGFSSFNEYTYDGKEVKIYISNDLETWELLTTIRVNYGTATYTLPANNAKYYRITLRDLGNSYASNNAMSISGGQNIVFNTAPAEGSIITVDYDIDCIPKDSDHVLDATITLQFGEYVEE